MPHKKNYNNNGYFWSHHIFISTKSAKDEFLQRNKPRLACEVRYHVNEKTCVWTAFKTEAYVAVLLLIIVTLLLSEEHALGWAIKGFIYLLLF